LFGRWKFFVSLFTFSWCSVQTKERLGVFSSFFSFSFPYCCHFYFPFSYLSFVKYIIDLLGLFVFLGGMK